MKYIKLTARFNMFDKYYWIKRDDGILMPADSEIVYKDTLRETITVGPESGFVGYIEALFNYSGVLGDIDEDRVLDYKIDRVLKVTPNLVNGDAFYSAKRVPTVSDPSPPLVLSINPSISRSVDINITSTCWIDEGLCVYKPTYSDDTVAQFVNLKFEAIEGCSVKHFQLTGISIDYRNINKRPINA